MDRLILFLIGCMLVGYAAGMVYLHGRAWLARLQRLHIRVPERILWALLASLLVLGHAAVTHASTPTPVPPTSTPVLLDIPVNTVLESANGWITTFAPIAAIGIGIAVAMAVLGYLGKMIKGAFS